MSDERAADMDRPKPSDDLTEAEARLWANPELMAQIQRAISDPSTLIRGAGRPRRHPD